MDHCDAIWACGFRVFCFLQCLDHLGCGDCRMVFEGPVLDTLGDGPVGLRRRVGPRGGELLVESVCQVFCGGERLLPLFPLELDRLVSPLFARLVVQRFYRPPKFCCVGPVVETADELPPFGCFALSDGHLNAVVQNLDLR